MLQLTTMVAMMKQLQCYDKQQKTQKGSGPPFYCSSRWRWQKHGESLFLIKLLKEKKAKQKKKEKKKKCNKENKI